MTNRINLKVIIITAALFSFILTGFAEAKDKLEPLSLQDVFALRGGFPETIETALKEEHMTMDCFLDLQSRTAASMKREDFDRLLKIRKKQLIPTSSTWLQKIISSDKIEDYLSGKYKAPKGFVSICSDVVHYRTPIDFYYGLRLDYPGSLFSEDMEEIGIIRFQAENAHLCVIPIASGFGGYFTDPYPFGGHGFTAAINGRWSSPEWVLPEFAILKEGSAIFELRKNGEEILRGVYDVKEKKFIRQ